MGTKWTDQDRPNVTQLRPKPGQPFYLYGADIARQVRDSLLANLDQPTQWKDDTKESTR